MDNHVLAAIKTEAERVYPKEACGVIIKVGKKPVAVPCENVDADPAKYFRISGIDFSRAADRGEIIGIWHTHPESSPQPSEMDIAGCEKSKLEWFIVGVYRNDTGFSYSDVVHLQPTGCEASYLERPYFFGIYDCWTLAQDFYQREFGITLSDFPRVDEWWTKGLDFFGDNFKSEGFIELVDQPPQVGDLFLIQAESNVPNHCAIYVGNDMILHHLRNRLSTQDIYGGGYWHKHTSHHLRNKLKC